jgi:hypothetical protein
MFRNFIALIVLSLLFIAWIAEQPGVCQAAGSPASGLTGKLQPAQSGTELTEFSSAQYGFTLQYPKKLMRRIPFNNPDVLLAVNPDYRTPPVLIVAVSREAETQAASMGILKASAEVLAGAGSFNPSLVKVVGEAEATTADGTPVKDMEFQAQLGRFPVEGFCTVARRADISIVVGVATWDNRSPYNKTEYSQITHSLKFVDKPVAQPAQPPVSTAQPVEATTAKATDLSFEAAEYRNEQYGFVFRHPNRWIQIPWRDPAWAKSAGILYTRGANLYGPWGWAGVLCGNTDFKTAVAGFLGLSAVTGTSLTASDTVLADGRQATKLVVRTTIPWLAEYQGVAVGVKKESNWLYVAMVAAPKLSIYDEALLSEIAHTLQLIPKAEIQLSEQIVDCMSPRQADVRWNVIIRNNTIPNMETSRWKIQSPLAAITVKRVWDEQGDIKFDYLLGPPIPPGNPDDYTLNFRLRKPLKPGDTYKLTIELDATADKELDKVYASVSGAYYQHVSNVVIAPPGYFIARTEPAYMPRVTAEDGRDKATIEGNYVKSLKLVAYLEKAAPKPEPATSGDQQTATSNGEPAATSAESESIATKLVNLPPYALIAAYAVLGVTVGLIAFFFIFRFQKKRRAEAFIKTKEAYEKKLAQWEKEGYDVDEYKKKWFKEFQNGKDVGKHSKR